MSLEKENFKMSEVVHGMGPEMFLEKKNKKCQKWEEMLLEKEEEKYNDFRKGKTKNVRSGI